MKLKYIIDALNHYYLEKFPNAKGWFIGKEYIAPTKINLYKKYQVSIYYHTPGKNHLAYTQELIDRCPEGTEEEFKEKFTISLLVGIFNNLRKFDEYEAFSI